MNQIIIVSKLALQLIIIFMLYFSTILILLVVILRLEITYVFR